MKVDRDYRVNVAPLFREAGVKTWAAFSKGLEGFIVSALDSGGFTVLTDAGPKDIAENELAVAIGAANESEPAVEQANLSVPDAAWLVARGVDGMRFARVLGMTESVEVEWDPIAPREPDAVTLAEFAGGEWAIAIGMPLGIAGVDVAELSERFDADVHQFVHQSTSGYVSWAKAVKGQVVRVFTFSSESAELLANVGEATSGEIEVGLGHLARCTADDVDDLLEALDEDSFGKVASAWGPGPFDQRWVRARRFAVVRPAGRVHPRE